MQWRSWFVWWRSYDVRSVHWRLNNIVKRKFTLFFSEYHKRFSSRVMKTFIFSLVLRTRENTDVFITLDENIYGIHSKRVNIFYIILEIRQIIVYKHQCFLKSSNVDDTYTWQNYILYIGWPPRYRKCTAGSLGHKRKERDIFSPL